MIPRSWEYNSARKWLHDSGYVFLKVHVTPHWYRFRQYEPRPGARYAMKRLSNGVMLVLEKMKP